MKFLLLQNRLVLLWKTAVKFDAESLDEYIASGGYEALSKALFDMTPEDVLNEVDKSKLRGRGGGGFPTGRKWKQVAAHKDVAEHFVVCNGDEGDPRRFHGRQCYGRRPIPSD